MGFYCASYFYLDPFKIVFPDPPEDGSLGHGGRSVTFGGFYGYVFLPEDAWGVILQ